MSLAWRILLFALLLNLLTVGGVQVVVHQAQQAWFENQRQLLRDSVQESFAELERVYSASAIRDAASDAAVVRRLLRSRSIDELYDDVIVTTGRPPYEGVYLNPHGAVHRDPDRFQLEVITAGIAKARQVDGLLPVADGYCHALRQGGEVVGYVWFVPRNPPRLPAAMPIWTTLLGVAASMVLFGAVLFWITRRTVGRPMQQIDEAAQAVGRGRYDVRLPVSNVPDLRQLIATFNEMAAQVADHTGTLEQAVRAAVAATEQKERALVQSSRLATIGTLAAGVAHEINNPIGGMQNAVNRLLQAEGLTDKQRVYLQLVHDGLTRVARTTRRLLEFSPRDARPGAFAVRDAAEGAFALVEHRAGQNDVAFRIELPPDLPPVFGDQHELQQVLLNLFLNSLDAIGRRGGAVTVSGRVEGGRVRVDVADDGPGMAEEDLSRVFDPFFSRKDRPDASGLGMFISYSIVQNHGGTMRVESSPGRGFRTILELLPAPAP
ncbi:MAG: HAMP domain-containing protein [Planctomycetes bacterium]|nr:HAMP domain-containing protein [Planctomycetota bacterium]